VIVLFYSEGISWLALGVAALFLIALRSGLAGMGFTLSLFIANAAFDDPGRLAVVKLGILMASILAGILGTGALLLFSRRSSETTQLEAAPAAD
jgi:NhaA family Na+:H+ antiporter